MPAPAPRLYPGTAQVTSLAVLSLMKPLYTTGFLGYLLHIVGILDLYKLISKD